MQMFIMGVTMAQGITMGAPLFGSPNDFLAMMKGQGMLGPLLASIGLKPVKFQSDSDFLKSLATESKVFSMYAVGVVKGYKRETRVKIHTVVDFRSAPSLTGSASATGTQPGTPQGGAQSSSSGQNQNAIAAALQPSIGGQILYYSIE
jgi:general secretion pathway protein K